MHATPCYNSVILQSQKRGVPLEIYAYQNNEGRYVKVSIHFFKNQLLHWMLAFDQKPNEIVAFWLDRFFRMGCQRVGI
jgi:hypothetical protein